MCKVSLRQQEQNGFTKLKEGVSQRHQEERGFGIGNGLRSGRDHMMQQTYFWVTVLKVDATRWCDYLDLDLKELNRIKNLVPQLN